MPLEHLFCEKSAPRLRHKPGIKPHRLVHNRQSTLARCFDQGSIVENTKTETAETPRAGAALTVAIMAAVVVIFAVRLALRSVANLLKLSAFVLAQPSRGLSWAALGADGLGRVSEGLTARLSARRAGTTVEMYYLHMAAKAASAHTAKAAKVEARASAKAAKTEAKAEAKTTASATAAGIILPAGN